MTWTDERVEQLKKLWSDGLSASQIAAELGGITRNAVIGKVHRLGLSGRTKAPSSSTPRPRKPRASHMLRVSRPAIRGNTALAQALFSTVQLRVLGLLFGQPERSYQGAELIRLARSGVGAVHLGLTLRAEGWLVTMTRVDSRECYQANADSPIFPELRGLIVKTVGMTAPLQAALAPFADRISAAFVYGSLARGTDTAKSDVDLMIVGDGLDYSGLYTALQGAEAALHRPVNPTIYAVKEFGKRKRAGNTFLQRVLDQPRLWVIGSDDAIP